MILSVDRHRSARVPGATRGTFGTFGTFGIFGIFGNLKTLGTLALALVLTGCAEESSSPSTGRWDSPIAGGAGFVHARGTTFELDGRDFYFQGDNLPGLATLSSYSEYQVYDTLAQLAARGVRVVRFWAFSCAGAVAGRPMITWANESNTGYDDEALNRLDVAMDAARSSGMKVILAMVNFEDGFCGMSWWVREVTGDSDKQKFYTDPRVKAAYKRHVATILNRVNGKYRSRHGFQLAYRDDPTIMSVELANEPHTQDWYEISRGWRAGDLTYEWLREMSDYVRGIDGNHLISSGEEGYRVSDATGHGRGSHAWIDNGSKGVDFARDVTLPNIDFATVHIYPDNWKIPSNEMDWVRSGLVEDRAQIAHAAGKPILLEESGFSFDAYFSPWGYQADRPGYLRRMYEFANEAGYAGTMVWTAVLPGQESGGYVIDLNDPAFSVIEAQANQMNRGEGRADSAGAPDCTGSTDSDPDRDGWGWENGRSCRFRYCADAASSDPARDGWGWEAGHSCRIPFCLSPVADPDGDGWGWEHGMSCISRRTSG